METVNQNGEKPKNTARQLPHESDPSGTSPNRYAQGSETGGGYDKQPDNHPAPHERMIEPDRGEEP